MHKPYHPEAVMNFYSVAELNDLIEALSQESGVAGDLEQVAICEAALNGDEEARWECARVIANNNDPY